MYNYNRGKVSRFKFIADCYQLVYITVFHTKISHIVMDLTSAFDWFMNIKIPEFRHSGLPKVKITSEKVLVMYKWQVSKMMIFVGVACEQKFFHDI